MKPTQQHYATNQMSLVGVTALLDKVKAYIYAQRCEDHALSWVLTQDWTPHIDQRRHHVKGHGCLKDAVKVRQVVKNMHDIVHGLKLRLALKKTFIGRISKGFDFLGYRFGALGLAGLAQQTIHNHKQRLLRLDEQGASNQRVENCVSNWRWWWTVSGLAWV